MSESRQTTDQRTPEWRYAIDQYSTHETRHEAIGAAAIINGYRGRIALGTGSRVSVWSYPVCSCEQGQADLSSVQICQRCGGAL